MRLLLFFLGSVLAGVSAELRVSTNFEGGSAHVTAIDQTARVVRFMPDGEPTRGWTCWWYLRVDGVARDERLTLELHGSDRPSRNNGVDTGKPLAPAWAMPTNATFSTDGATWRQTTPGRRDGPRITYEVIGTGGPLWIAWGPPFTPRHTDELLAAAERKLPGAARGFEVARTLQGRPVRALRVTEGRAKHRPGIWFTARQHAWESGASWVARGLTEWLLSDDPDARWLRDRAEVVIVPIMDVDNAATGNGGKEAAPRDHNRDWDDAPVYPEVAAVQRALRTLAKENRLSLYLDLHNPAPADVRPFFFVGPAEAMTKRGPENLAAFLAAAKLRIAGPLVLNKERATGPGYHPLWKNISNNWVTLNGNPHTVAACLETSWNTPHSTPEGYGTVGRQLGLAVVDYLRASTASEEK